MLIDVLNKPTGLRGLLSGWGWPLFSGAIFGLLIYLALLPFPHRSAAIYLGASGCMTLREAGFSVEPRPSGCLLDGAYREEGIPGFISIRQGEGEMQIRTSEIMAIKHKGR
ncbi:MAG: hypothetical protein Q8O79_02885 [Pseudomonadota bacterium]|nr:hypothetical protein [Pseudomonadota bacterium]